MNGSGWNIYKKYQLYVLYSAGATLKIISRYLNSTPTAINKCLLRFNIRSSGKNPELIKHFKIKTMDDVQRVLTAFKLDQSNLDEHGLGKSCYETLKYFGLNPSGVWPRKAVVVQKYNDTEIFKARSDSKVAQQSGTLLSKSWRQGTAKSIDVNLSTVIDYLNDSGVPVQSLDRRLFCVNDKLIADFQLLVLANKKRIDAKLPIFHVDNVTVS